MQVPSFVAILAFAYVAAADDILGSSASEDITTTITTTITTYQFNNVTSAAPFVAANSTTRGYMNSTSGRAHISSSSGSRGYANSTAVRPSNRHTSANMTMTLTPIPANYTSTQSASVTSSYSKYKKPAYNYSKKPEFKFTKVPKFPCQKHTKIFKCCHASKLWHGHKYDVEFVENVTSSSSGEAGSGFARATKASITAAICGVIAAFFI